ncbi:MAG: hypothetical protein ACT4QG_17150 [Sporichthyaceae bacterium]
MIPKALLRHPLGASVGMVLVGVIAAGVLAERKRQPIPAPEAEPEPEPLPPVGRAGLFARLASAYEKRRPPKTYRR